MELQTATIGIVFLDTNDSVQVALKKFVDDISVLAIEQSFIRRLPSLFSAEEVTEMAPEEISRLAAESQETAHERAMWKEKHEVLKSGLRELRRFGQQRPVEPGKHSRKGIPHFT